MSEASDDVVAVDQGLVPSSSGTVNNYMSSNVMVEGTAEVATAPAANKECRFFIKSIFLSCI